MHIMEQLRSETSTMHQHVNHLPYFKALEKAELPIESYIGHLRVLAIIHGSLEREIGAVQHPTVTRVWRPSMGRSHILLKDLEQLESESRTATPREAMQAAHELADKIALRRINDPVSLLGYVYVLEGSSLGAQLFWPKIASTFNLSPGPGILYYMQEGTDTVEKWKELSTRMDEAVVEQDEKKTILDAAIELFDGLAVSLGALYPQKGVSA